LLFVLAFHNEWQYRHVNARVNSGDDVATSCKNWVKFNLVTPEITSVEIEIFATTGQKKLGKNRHI